MTDVEALLESAGVHPSWVPVLAANADDLMRAMANADADRADHRVAPEPADVLRAFRVDLHRVRVVIVGQDPYPTPGHAVGLSFAVSSAVRPVPRSLANIYRELHADLGVEIPDHGDLSAWTAQGVLLLNRVLTVRTGVPGSHRGSGWEAVTAGALAALDARTDRSLVALLWGRDARSCASLMPNTTILESPHPSPLSASRGFFGSKPFSRANEILVERGEEPIDWSIPRLASSGAIRFTCAGRGVSEEASTAAAASNARPG